MEISNMIFNKTLEEYHDFKKKFIVIKTWMSHIKQKCLTLTIDSDFYILSYTKDPI